MRNAGTETERVFFSEEKKQKTFMSAPALHAGHWPETLMQTQEIKVFWFFSSEKNMLACSINPQNPFSRVARFLISTTKSRDGM